MYAGLIRLVPQAINNILPRIWTVGTIQSESIRRFHYICDRQKLNCIPRSLSTHNTSSLLQPVSPMYNSVCGLKARGSLQLRCKDCYFLCKDERWYVMCKTHPRHKQVKIKKKDYKTWILTWASQSKIRGW